MSSQGIQLANRLGRALVMVIAILALNIIIGLSAQAIGLRINLYVSIMLAVVLVFAGLSTYYYFETNSKLD